jgi:hypothetical protein
MKIVELRKVVTEYSSHIIMPSSGEIFSLPSNWANRQSEKRVNSQGSYLSLLLFYVLTLLDKDVILIPSATKQEYINITTMIIFMLSHTIRQ